MNSKKIGLAIGIVVALGIAWALFRPELLFVNSKVSEASVAGKTVKKGSFQSFAHETKGSAEVIEGPQGAVLRLSGFETSNGPDVHVLLSDAENPGDSGSVKAGHSVELGSLKGNLGDQNYGIPAGTDVSELKHVVIWCQRFSVSFGAATLQ